MKDLKIHEKNKLFVLKFSNKEKNRPEQNGLDT